MYQVVCLGDAMMDFFVFPKESEISVTGKTNGGISQLRLEYGDKIPVSKAATEIGGSAANVAVGLTRLGIKTAIASTIGKDYAAELIYQRLAKEGVETKYLKKSVQESAFSIIISYQGERTILVYHLDDYSLLKIPGQSQWFYIGSLGKGFEKVYAQAISRAAEKDVNIALNPGKLQLNDRACGAILRVTKILILNREEAQKLLGLARVLPIDELLKDLHRHGPEIVVITDGPEGAYCYDGIRIFRTKAYPAQRKESTGAGDAFSAGFLGAIIYGRDTTEALHWGAVNSAFVIEKIGAQTGLATKSKIQKEMANFRWPNITQS